MYVTITFIRVAFILASVSFCVGVPLDRQKSAGWSSESDFGCTLDQSPGTKAIFYQNNRLYNQLGATVFALLYGCGFT